MIEDLIASESFGTMFAAVIALIVASVMKMESVKKTVEKYKLQKIGQTLSATVSNTYETYVRERKKMAADGKLTEDERREARSIAIDQASDLLRQEGIDLAKHYGPVVLNAMVEKFVTAKKSGPLPAPLSAPELDM